MAVKYTSNVRERVQAVLDHAADASKRSEKKKAFLAGIRRVFEILFSPIRSVLNLLASKREPGKSLQGRVKWSTLDEKLIFNQIFAKTSPNKFPLRGEKMIIAELSGMVEKEMSPSDAVRFMEQLQFLDPEIRKAFLEVKIPTSLFNHIEKLAKQKEPSKEDQKLFAKLSQMIENGLRRVDEETFFEKIDQFQDPEMKAAFLEQKAPASVLRKLEEMKEISSLIFEKTGKLLDGDQQRIVIQLNNHLFDIESESVKNKNVLFWKLDKLKDAKIEKAFLEIQAPHLLKDWEKSSFKKEEKIDVAEEFEQILRKDYEVPTWIR